MKKFFTSKVPATVAEALSQFSQLRDNLSNIMQAQADNVRYQEGVLESAQKSIVDSQDEIARAQNAIDKINNLIGE